MNLDQRNQLKKKIKIKMNQWR